MSTDQADCIPTGYRVDLYGPCLRVCRLSPLCPALYARAQTVFGRLLADRGSDVLSRLANMRHLDVQHECYG